MNIARHHAPPRSIEASGTDLYYRKNAQRYYEATIAVDMSPIYARFLKYIPAGASILDAGSGSGRDTLAFLQRGHHVKAFDASPELAKLSSRLTGLPTQVTRFQDFEASERFDGIWSCAALLHVPRGELPDALRRLGCALKSGGALYLSFKLGRDEHIAEDGRFFTDMNEASLQEILGQVADILSLRELWRTSGESKFRARGDWLNAIAIRTA